MEETSENIVAECSSHDLNAADDDKNSDVTLYPAVPQVSALSSVRQ